MATMTPVELENRLLDMVRDRAGEMIAYAEGARSFPADRKKHVKQLSMSFHDVTVAMCGLGAEDLARDAMNRANK